MEQVRMEGDIFKIIIPLSMRSMAKVGPGISPVVSVQVIESSVQDETIIVKGKLVQDYATIERLLLTDWRIHGNQDELTKNSARIDSA